MIRLLSLSTPVANRGGSILFVATISLSILTGCDGESPSKKTPNSKPATVAIKAADDQQCEKLLDNAFISLRPENLGISSDRDTGISLLNQWATVCGDTVAIEFDPDRKISPTLKNLLQPEEQELIVNPYFLQRDAEHLRDSIWYENVVERVAANTPDDLDRVVELFYFVIRHLALVETESEIVPQALFDTCLLGRGTAQDRAWLFANLLRPLQIDTVILSPTTTDSENDPQNTKSVDWLVGVLVEGDVFLFDTRLGLPIPENLNGPKSPMIQQPASLTEVMESPELLTQLDLDDNHPYPLKSADLKNLRVELIGDTSLWSRRMLQLQMSLAGDRAVTIYDGLEDNELRKGLVSRIAEAGSKFWTKKNISVWPYPEKRLVASENLDFDQRETLEKQQLSFAAPIPIIEIKPNDQQMLELKYGPPRQQHLKARNAQVRGETRQAIRSYLSIRLWNGIPPFRALKPNMKQDPGQPIQQSQNSYIYVNLLEVIPPQYREIIASRIDPKTLSIHQIAADEAFFWVGSCQMEQRKYAAAAASFSDYLKRHPQGVWTSTARSLLAVSLAKSGEREEAIATLEKSSDKAPQHHGHTLLIRRWKSQLKDKKPAKNSTK